MLTCLHGALTLSHANRPLLGAERLPTLLVQHIASAAQEGGRPQELQQFVISFTLADWQEMRRIVEPAECVMRHREGNGGAAAQQQAAAQAVLRRHNPPAAPAAAGAGTSKAAGPAPAARTAQKAGRKRSAAAAMFDASLDKENSGEAAVASGSAGEAPAGKRSRCALA